MAIYHRYGQEGLGRRLLYWDKFATLLTEVEAILNTHPLTYICKDLNSSFVLLVHFITGGCNNALPFIQMLMMTLNTWILLRNFYNIGKDPETASAVLEIMDTSGSQRSIVTSEKATKIGEIVIVKDNNLPCRAWKITKIKFIFSEDKQIKI